MSNSPQRRSACCQCVRYPYQDNYLIVAQVFSILALGCSWVFYGTFAISLIAMILQQVLWCCRQTRSGMVASVVLSFLAAAVCAATSLYMFLGWKGRADKYAFDTDYVSYCEPFTFYFLIGNRSRDMCKETLWASLAAASAFLWLISGCFLERFLSTGRYNAWEERMDKGDTNQKREGAPVAEDKV